ncbi:LCP family protein [Nesterenkonia sp.]|uniref:LCP family protein n=1 Tax=Nesterenkonia sp. TaxID=704201 RepID=UPI00262B2E7E|nr:LCP family protein [Nesterenkonia sp.]
MDPHRPRRARGGVVPEAAPAAPSPRRRRRRIAAIVVAAVAVAAAVAVVISLGYLSRLQGTFEDNRNVIEGLEDLDDDTAYRTPEGTTNILLLGSDSRGDTEQEYRAITGEGGERSDVIMLVHIPEDRSGVYVMSIMRDLWVEVPGHGEGRINSAFSAGGLELAVDTVEEMLYTHIDHVVTIDFEGFSDLTTALGGVYVDNPRSFSAGQRNPAFYPEGTIRLQGSDALRFVRERKSFAMGDHVRVENQQLVLRAIVERFLSGDTLTNPERILDVLESILPFMSMDGSLDADTVVGYAMEMRNLRSSDIHMFTMPVGQNHETSGGAQVILPDEEKMQLLQRSLQHQNLDGFMAYLEESEAAEQLQADREIGAGPGSFTGGGNDAP